MNIENFGDSILGTIISLEINIASQITFFSSVGARW